MSTIRRPSVVEQLTHALGENRRLKAERADLADRLARVDVLRARMAGYGSPEAQRWAGVLGEILTSATA